MSDEVKFRVVNNSDAFHGECFNLGGGILLPAKSGRPGSGEMLLPLRGLLAARDLPGLVRRGVVRVYLDRSEVQADQLIELVKGEFGVEAHGYGDRPVKTKRNPLQVLRVVQMADGPALVADAE